MTVARTPEGWQLSLKPRGAGRYVTSAFLAFWLCMWAVGEGLALWILVTGADALVTGQPPAPGRAPLEAGPAVIAGVFLVLWLTLWTIGGIAAFAELSRLLWGEDRITLQSGRLTVTWMRGLYHTRRSFERDAIRRVALAGRRDHLTLETARERVELSALGTRDERFAGAAALRTELGMSESISGGVAVIPTGWEEIITPEGERALVADLVTRRTRARVASAVTMVLAAATFVVARGSLRRADLVVPALVLLAITVGLGAGALWLARGRWEWRIGAGRLTLRKRYGSSVRDVFECRSLVVDSSTDSDGDMWYILYATGGAERPGVVFTIHSFPAPPGNARAIARLMDDGSRIRDLAAWLSHQTGLPVDDRTTFEGRAAQMAEMRALLLSSGRFGKWAAALIDRLSGERKAG